MVCIAREVGWVGGRNSEEPGSIYKKKEEIDFQSGDGEKVVLFPGRKFNTEGEWKVVERSLCLGYVEPI